MNSVFGGLHHDFSEAVYSQIKIRKIGDKKLSVFNVGSIICHISWVIGVINEFGFRCFVSFLDTLTAR